ncbi:hypothetical protein LIER_30692 [Lithospermum erythrorhizon]|uniref:Helitron helicase-like domain-containing protein n=1 Tax=Lithospermum erythrorhizon TaxID=34254 RepID=A0AAV3RRR0_LITER
MIRTYNNHLVYSSISIHCDEQFERRNRGIYIVRAQRQLHHFLNDLVPADTSSKVSGLVRVMEPNPYSLFLRSLCILEELERYYIVIKSDSTIEQRVYNKPSSTDVLGEPGWHGNIPAMGFVLVEPSGNQLSQYVLDPSDLNYFEDVLANKMAGHNLAKKRYIQGDVMNGSIVRPNKRSIVSCRQYYAYKLQQRQGSKVGTRVYLPPTLIRGPRDMRHRYLESMYLIQEFGKPELFFTMNCNSNFPEIKECFSPREEVKNRPDLVVRVFKSKASCFTRPNHEG